MPHEPFLLTVGKERVLKTKGKRLVCSRCGERIKPGQEVATNFNWKKYYHKECFEEMRI